MMNELNNFEIVEQEKSNESNFRVKPDIQKFYHYVAEHDLREEALILLNDKIVEKKASPENSKNLSN